MIRGRNHLGRITLATALSLGLVAIGTQTLRADQHEHGKEKVSESKPMAEHEAMMAEMAKYMNPGPQHKALEPLVGKWSYTSKMWMGPGEPQAYSGKAERKWILGGRFVLGTFSGDFGGQPFEGLQITGYDLRTNEYVDLWIDSMGTGFMLGNGGTMDAATKTLALNSSYDMPDLGPLKYKMITKVIDNDHHVFTMMKVMDGEDHKEMEITYTRVK